MVGCEAPDANRGWECLAPANPGGGWDLTCRSVGQVLRELELSPGLVRTTNLPGAGGGVAYARTVARRTSDPSVLVAASPATILRLAQRQFGSLTEHDVRWVGALGAEYGVLAVAADAP
ncbi:MAG: tripartite tricarboxylate transporter substrate binding protein, partial [Gemmatimonadota bacterium]|nr:tripartite tricarboxylate transporter substrate binding protein [Gemmatimonadota bacterium]